MRRTLKQLLLVCLAGLTLVIPQAAPASAGAGYWSTTDCTTFNGWPYARTDIQWYSRSSPYSPYGPQILYWLDGYSQTYSYHVVENSGNTHWLDYYAAGGYQCNWPGAPLTNWVQCPGFLPLPYQAMKFEGGVFVADTNGNIRNKTWGQGANADPCHYSNW